MGLERANGAFGCIVEMNIGMEKLVVYFPNVFHGSIVLFTGFIVQDLDIKELIKAVYPGCDIVVCEDSMLYFVT